jgi:hypothetical protein
MRRVNPWIAALFPLLLAAGACSRSDERRIVAPAPPGDDPPGIAEAHWIWEPEALAASVTRAGSSPAVQSALREAPVAGLTPAFQHVVRAVGSTATGVPLSLTILPYAVKGDPTHAAFISVAEGHGTQVAEFAEMISGRDPAPGETGFVAATWGDHRVWIRTSESFALGANGIRRAALRRNWGKLFQCLAERVPLGCAAGSSVANEFLPGEPRAAAIGCGVGGALGAMSCVGDWLTGR